MNTLEQNAITYSTSFFLEFSDNKAFVEVWKVKFNELIIELLFEEKINAELKYAYKECRKYIIKSILIFDVHYFTNSSFNNISLIKRTISKSYLNYKSFVS